MSKQVRVGLVGTSWWADSLLIDSILADQPVLPNFHDGFKT